MPPWIHIVVLLVALATPSRADVIVKDSRSWYPETDEIFFKMPDDINDVTKENTKFFTEMNETWALNIPKEDDDGANVFKGAFVVGSPYVQGENSVRDPIIDFTMRIKSENDATTLEKYPTVSLTLLTRKGETDVVFKFQAVVKKWLFIETEDIVAAFEDISVQIFKNGEMKFNNKKVVGFATPFNSGYEHVWLKDTKEQIIPFKVTTAFDRGILVRVAKDRLALIYPKSQWTITPPGFTPGREYGPDDPDGPSGGGKGGEAGGETTTDESGGAKGAAKAGFSDWYYIIIIVAIFLVFMVALAVVLFIKKRMRDKKRKETENRRLTPSLSSHQQSMDQELQGGTGATAPVGTGN